MTTTTTITFDELLSLIQEQCDTAHIGDYYVAVSREADSSGDHLVVVVSMDTARHKLIVSVGTALPVQGACLSAWLDTNVLPDDDHIDYEDVIEFIRSIVGRL